MNKKSWVSTAVCLAYALFLLIRLTEYRTANTDLEIKLEETKNSLDIIVQETQDKTKVIEKVQKEREDDLVKFGQILKEHVEEIDRLEEEMQIKKDKEMTIVAEVTSYAPLDPEAEEGMCYSGDPSITATGSTVRRGVAAADFRKLPPGTVLEIPGYGVATVEDTGGALRNHSGYAIDVFLPTRGEAMRWGRKTMEVKILYMPKKEG